MTRASAQNDDCSRRNATSARGAAGAGRLTSESLDHYDDLLDQTAAWTYDLAGNRTRQTIDKGNNSTLDETTTYSYDSNDRLLSEVKDLRTGTDTTTVYSYTGTQQAAKTVGVTGSSTLVSHTTFEYDLQGRLSQAVVDSYTGGTVSRKERTTYRYDDRGIRVSSLQENDADVNGTYESASKVVYLNDPQNHTGHSQVISETRLDPVSLAVAERRIYTHGHDLIAQTTILPGPLNTTTRYFVYDGHGSTRLLTDGAGQVVAGQVYAYDAYGNAIGFDPAAALTSYLYSGEQFDTRVQMQYLRARYYDPNTGRFNQLDPFAGNNHDPQSLHKYLYVHGDPVNGIDPSGWFTGTVNDVNLTTGLSAKISLSIGASALLLAKAWQSARIRAEFQQLEAVATDLGTDVITSRDMKQPGAKVFLHGTNIAEWSFLGMIDATIGRVGDFGIGYYTFPAEDSRSLGKVTERAQPWKGIPFIIVTAVDLPTWQLMSKWDLTINTTSGAQYKEIVTSFRDGVRSPFTSYHVVFGEVAKPRPVTKVWIRQDPEAGFPWQYKFEQAGVDKSRIIGILPVPRHYA